MQFEYFEPSSIQEAITLLTEKNSVKVMAGGTDLVVGIKMEKIRPNNVVALEKIPGLLGVNYDEGQRLLSIGALATHSDVLALDVIRKKYTALADASSVVGSRQVRNLGTVVGNVCHASPSAETAGPLLVLETSVRIAGAAGTRVVPLTEFFLCPGKTVLSSNEIVTELLVPVLGPNSASAYFKLSPRRAMDLALVGVAVAISYKNGICEHCRIALGAVAPTPLRARQAESILDGQEVTDDLIRKAGEIAAEESRPITDIRGSADYRREMVRVLVRRALKEAVDRVGR